MNLAPIYSVPDRPQICLNINEWKTHLTFGLHPPDPIQIQRQQIKRMCPLLSEKNASLSSQPVPFPRPNCGSRHNSGKSPDQRKMKQNISFQLNLFY